MEKNKISVAKARNNTSKDKFVIQPCSSTIPEDETFIAEASSPTPLKEEDFITQNNKTSTESRMPIEDEFIDEASTPKIEDIITEDVILCSILSRLRLSEAIRTCVLSPRWRRIWTHLPNLNFCPQYVFDAHTVSLIEDDSPLTKDEKLQLLEQKTDQFVHSVDTVMQQLAIQLSQGLVVDQFMVRYFIPESHFHYLDEWICVALSPKTKVLGLYLNKPLRMAFTEARYEFRCPPLGSSSSLEELVLICCSLILPPKFSGFSHLKILKLYNLDVTEEDVTRLVSNCYTLECLKLLVAPRVVTLSVPHPQTRLRELAVQHCFQCREVKIYAPNLNKLWYIGYPANFLLGYPSHMEYALITFKVEYRVPEPNLDYYLNKISSNLPRLTSLFFSIIDEFEVSDVRTGIDSFLHLTHLDWCWNAGVKMTLLHLSAVLDACPVLEELSLRFRTPCTTEQPPQRLQKYKKMLPKHPHTHLKTIKFYDFYCDKWHIEFALYLLKNATELKSMVINKGNRGLDEAHMKNLKRQVPAKVKLVIP